MNPSPTPKRQSRTRREQGIALVTVLAILTLTAVLVMAFFTVSRSELASSTVYSRGIEASHISKAAVDMVIHQIRSATERKGVAWATQPGMVRTWATSSNGAQECFKLYSDESMVVNESQVFDDVNDMQNWQNDVRFVDLNAPIARIYSSTEEFFYPIIDPKAAFGPAKVEGFSVDFAAVGASPGSRTLPMPVKWIYQLEDGTLGTLVGGGSTGTFQPLSGPGGGAGNGQATSDNPIVARFAFWADDETAKLNVNTAAGGVAWDTPRAGGVSDRNYGQFQPVANEFQRYPGHPATVSMIHVLYPSAALPNSDLYDKGSAELYYSLIPRIQKGGSGGGGYAGAANQYGLIRPIQPDEDRLYATIDEFIFKAPQVGLSDGKTSATFKRLPQPKAGLWPELRPADLGLLQFFLTATSKAPEVTIFNTPRISVWPSYYGDPTDTPPDPHFTSYDRRLRFCAEVGKRQGPADSRAPEDPATGKSPAMYHFQRMNAASCTKDYTEIIRNRELYAYLQEMMSATIPGMDVSDGVTNYGSFEGKYGSRNRDQIITEVFDYVRSLNLFDDLLMKQHGIQKVTPVRLPNVPTLTKTNFVLNEYYGYWDPQPTGNGANYNPGNHPSFTPGRLCVYKAPDTTNGHAAYIGADTHTGHGQVAPIIITPPGGQETKGFGRSHGVKEVGIAMLACAQDNGFPGGEARQAVGVVNAGSINETWSTTGARVSGLTKGIPPTLGSKGTPDRVKVDSTLKPAWDYSNVPPLSATTPAHVFQVYNLITHTAVTVSGDGTIQDTGVALTPGDLGSNDTNKMIPSRPPMGGLDFYNYVTNDGNWNRTLEEDTPLTGGATQVQAMLLVSLFCPSKGWTLINPDFRLEIDVQQDFTLGGQPFGFPPPGPQMIKTPHAAFRRIWGGRDSGGILEPRMLAVSHVKTGDTGADKLAFSLGSRCAPATALLNIANTQLNQDSTPLNIEPSEGEESYTYPWISTTLTIPGNGGLKANAAKAPSVPLAGGRLVIKLFPDGGSRTDGADSTSMKIAVENIRPNNYSQMVTIQFAPTNVPLPILVGAANGNRREGPRTGEWSALPGTEALPREQWSWNRDGAFKSANFPPGTRAPIEGVRPGLNSGRLNLVFGYQNTGLSEGPVVLALGGNSLCNPCDVIRSYVIPHGDDRLVCAMREVPAGSSFVPHKEYTNASRLVACNFTVDHANVGYGRSGIPQMADNTPNLFAPKSFVPDANPPNERKPILPDNFRDGVTTPGQWDDPWGDWDNGIATELDGPYINKPDEGNAMGVAYNNYEPKPWVTGSVAREFIPYFTEAHVQEPAGPGLWSPNRIMPGPGMFGSLPTGVFPGPSGRPAQPWQTLLFRRLGGTPQQSAMGVSPRTGQVHPGWQHPRDHYLLDFFWMPVVEPYSISEPLATAGKINMNYAIQPFDYIKRTSSLLGVFASEELLTVPNKLQVNGAVANHYKDGEGWGGGSGTSPKYERTSHTGGNLITTSLRSWIGATETLKQFDAVFAGGSGTPPQIFRTASQICEQWLIPGKPVKGNPYGVGNGLTLQNVSQYYNPDRNGPAGERSFGLVGDNARERPYTNLVARLTTKSNTFNVHYRAQVLRQSPLSPTTPGARRTDAEYAVFNSAADKMVGEFRGSSIVERYIDPNDLRIPDYASIASGPGDNDLGLGNSNQTQTLDKFYRFRIVSEKRFAP